MSKSNWIFLMKNSWKLKKGELIFFCTKCNGKRNQYFLLPQRNFSGYFHSMQNFSNAPFSPFFLKEHTNSFHHFYRPFKMFRKDTKIFFFSFFNAIHNFIYFSFGFINKTFSPLWILFYRSIKEFKFLSNFFSIYNFLWMKFLLIYIHNTSSNNSLPQQYFQFQCFLFHMNEH